MSAVRRTVAVLSAFAVSAACLVGLAGPAQAAATTNAAFWSMDEPAGTTALLDSSGNGVTAGTVGADVQSGVLFAGATAKRFPDISPTQPPARPEHLVTVPDNNPKLDPDAADYAVTVRYRTTKAFGNVVQKGQNASVGGYWKFEQPNGFMTCLFKGGNGQQRAVKSTVALNDGQWHTVRCERLSTGVRMYVDGVFHNQLNGPTGTINNALNVSIGGKSNCDQISVTCDYFVGDLDYIRIEKGSGGPANQPPVPVLTPSCTGLACSFSGASSTDSDGAIQSYAWDFGDGGTASTGSIPTASHSYTAAGTYTVSLTVTDDRGAQATTSTTVTVAPVAEVVSFVGAANSSANALSRTVTVPASVQPGDGLLLFLSENTHATISDPTGVTGWTVLDSIDGATTTTRVWRKVAAAGDGGSAVTVSVAVQSKLSLSVAAYRGTSATDPVAGYAKATDSASSATRITPNASVTVPQSWAVSYWLHGDSSTSALVPQAGVTARVGGTQTGGGRVTTLLADSAVSVPPGSYGGIVATAAAASTTTATWTVVLAPAG